MKFYVIEYEGNDVMWFLRRGYKIEYRFCLVVFFRESVFGILSCSIGNMRILEFFGWREFIYMYKIE